MCYIVPQTLLTANDLDVIRYHLAKFTTIEKIVTFSGRMFVGRGLRQDKPVATSSLIFVVRRKQPDGRNFVEIVNSDDSSTDIEECLTNIQRGKNVRRKKILQNKLLQEVGNWNFINHEADFLSLHRQYKLNTESIAEFRARLSARNDLVFDGGVKIKQSLVIHKEQSDCFEVFDYRQNRWDRYSVSRSGQYYPKTGPFQFIPGSQGLAAYGRKYKVVWRTRFAERFQFTNREIVLVNNQSLTVACNSRETLLFYFALLNSPINKLILDKSFRQENERNYFIPLRALKACVRIPTLSDPTEVIRNEIVKATGRILGLEDVYLGDIVDFSSILMQKFDGIAVEGSHVILRKGRKEKKVKIKKDKDVVERTIAERYPSDGLEFEKGKVLLSELKTLAAIDFEEQAQLKDYIDDLVFALYFNVRLPRVGLDDAEEIKKACKKSRYYRILDKYG